MLLGRVKSAYDPRLLHLRNYMAVDTLPVPPTHNMIEHTDGWPMLANDQFNCCTSAAAGHMVHHWTTANQDAVMLTDKDIIEAHAKLTRDQLMEPVSMLDALRFWRKSGIGNHRIYSYMSAGRPQPSTLRGVIFLFGAAYVGLDLPNFAIVGPPAQVLATPWQLSPNTSPEDAAPQDKNGHCVATVGYDEDSVYAVTWGTLKSMSWDFFTLYTDEVYAVLSTDWVQRDKESPSGFDMKTLARDLSLVSH